MRIEVVAVGSELLNGDLADRHTARFGRLLRALGLGLQGSQSVPDEVDLLLRALERAADRAELVLVTGGLGATDDGGTGATLVAHLRRNPPPASGHIASVAHKLQ